MTVERYGAYWVNLAKTRPAVIVSDDEMNAHLGTVVVCPITSRIHPRWPSRVQAIVAGKVAEIAVDQIRTIAKTRLGPRIDGVDPAVAAALRHVITQMYGVLSVSSEA